MLNERPHEAPRDETLFSLRDRVQPAADVTILNGFPLKEDHPLSDGDEVVLIQRGAIPSSEELEAMMVSRHGPGVHERVRKGRVGIAGCGGLGSALAIALARTGVGKLLLVDFDVVEPSNLNRQQFFIDQLGQPKVDALAANLARINPYVQIEVRNMRLTRENMPEVFADCDIVAECFDDPAMKRDIAIAISRGLPRTPLVAVSGLAGFAPSNGIVTRKSFGRMVLVGDGDSAAQPGRGLLAPRVAIAAGHQANAILRLLLGLDPVEQTEKEENIRCKSA